MKRDNLIKMKALERTDNVGGVKRRKSEEEQLMTEEWKGTAEGGVERNSLFAFSPLIPLYKYSIQLLNWFLFRVSWRCQNILLNNLLL